MLSWHWIPVHRDNGDLVALEAMQPRTLKLLDPDPELVREVFRRVPNLALLVVRDWALTEQHNYMLEDPEGLGRVHAQRYMAWVRDNGLEQHLERMAFESINEPRVWLDGVPEALDLYSASFARSLRAMGGTAVLGNFSVGWPGNDGPDMPPRWDRYPEMEEALHEHRAILGLHEYWGRGGVDEGWSWYAGRYVRCPWRVPIYIGECGLEQAALEDIPTGAGWRRYVDADTYLAQLRDYAGRLLEDGRVIGGAVFTYDWGSDNWADMDIRPIRDRFAQVFRGDRWPPVYPDWDEEWPGQDDLELWTLQDDPRVVWPLPGRAHVRISQWWGEHPDAYWGKGHNGLDIPAPTGTPVLAMADGVVLWAGYDESYGNYVRILHPDVRWAGSVVQTFYAHMVDTPKVRRNERVTAGQVIGNVGSTGRSTGPHLHLEVRLSDESGVYLAGANGWGKGRRPVEGWLAAMGLQIG